MSEIGAELVAEHQPCADCPGLFFVSDFLLDSTLNACLKSAETAVDLVAIYASNLVNAGAHLSLEPVELATGFAKNGSEFHGPRPPSPDWKLKGKGPKGGKIWAAPKGQNPKQTPAAGHAAGQIQPPQTPPEQPQVIHTDQSTITVGDPMAAAKTQQSRQTAATPDPKKEPTPEAAPTAPDHDAGVLSRAKQILDTVPGARWLQDRTKQLYVAMEKRYGPKAAKMIFASGYAISYGAMGVGAVTGTPITIPAAVAMAPAAAIAELHHQLAKMSPGGLVAQLSVDDTGREHKGKGGGWGQFTSESGDDAEEKGAVKEKDAVDPTVEQTDHPTLSPEQIAQFGKHFFDQISSDWRRYNVDVAAGREGDGGVSDGAALSVEWLELPAPAEQAVALSVDDPDGDDEDTDDELGNREERAGLIADILGGLLGDKALLGFHGGKNDE